MEFQQGNTYSSKVLNDIVIRSLIKTKVAKYTSLGVPFNNVQRTVMSICQDMTLFKNYVKTYK